MYYRTEMTQIDDKLSKHCEEHQIISELRSELNYRIKNGTLDR